LDAAHSQGIEYVGWFKTVKPTCDIQFSNTKTFKQLEEAIEDASSEEEKKAKTEELVTFLNKCVLQDCPRSLSDAESFLEFSN